MDELVIPEDLTTLNDEDLEALRGRATSTFEAIYAQEGEPTDDDIASMTTLSDVIDTIKAEQAKRTEVAAARAEAAAQLAAKVTGEITGQITGEIDTEETPAEEAPAAAETEAAADEEAVAASAGPKRINLSSLRPRRQPTPAPEHHEPEAPTSGVRVFTADGESSTILDIAQQLNQKLPTKATQIRGRQQMALARIERVIPSDQIIDSSAPDLVARAFDAAADQSKLPGGSLVAAGGWCAPSVTDYTIPNGGETTEGIISLPQVAISRGGLNFTRGPKFSDFYGKGFNYTEDEDIVGDYDGAGGGTKPVYRVDCPDFEDVRMDVAGVAIQAGLLQSRGYPEMIARTISGVLVAHEHDMAKRVISAIAGASTPIVFPAATGATAPLLRAIEIQTLAYRTASRLSPTATLEAVFPMWVKGLVRADLSLRTGVDLISVTDAQIVQWFTAAGVVPQFVYNWQDVATNATAYPETLDFLLYRAGTWVKGTGAVITLENVYDSVLLGKNDYTALFTEEGWLVAQRMWDSRKITVPVCPNGATAAGELLDCTGGPVAP